MLRTRPQPMSGEERKGWTSDERTREEKTREEWREDKRGGKRGRDERAKEQEYV